jgi:glycerophosphoryl diester phosphodiesterase
MESFRQAIALGVDGLEFDVRLSKDGEVVVLHDPTLDRTTNARGAVADYTAAELQGVDAGAQFARNGAFPYRGRGITVPLLRDVLQLLPEVPVLIEIKVPEAAEPVRRVIEEAGAAARCIVAAFDERTLRPFAGSGIPTSAATAQVARLLRPALAGRRLTAVPFQIMSLPRSYRGLPVPLGALARAVAPAGVPVHAWTINDPRTARRLRQKGVRGILSDDPAAIITENTDNTDNTDYIGR